MCVILACDKKTGRPTKQMLKDAEQMNSDGGSIAWINGDKVQWSKGLKAKQIFKIMKKIKLPFVIHFRIATHGGTSKPLCHPFPITEKVGLGLEGKADSVLFHNGIWSEHDEFALKAIINHKLKYLDGKISDSRTMAWMVYHFGKQILNAIPEGNKMTILTPRGIEYFGKGWVKVEKIFCSNDHFDSNFTTYGDSNYDVTDDTDVKQEDYLYDEMGELSATWNKTDCTFHSETDSYEAPDGDVLYSVEHITANDEANEKWMEAEREMEDMKPLGTNPKNALVSKEAFESSEWENRQWYNKHKRNNHNGMGGFYP